MGQIPFGARGSESEQVTLLPCWGGEAVSLPIRGAHGQDSCPECWSCGSGSLPGGLPWEGTGVGAEQKQELLWFFSFPSESFPSKTIKV